MANTSAYITAGLPFPKEGEAQTGGETSAYVTAGLPKVVEVVGGLSIPVAMHHYTKNIQAA